MSNAVEIQVWQVFVKASEVEQSIELLYRKAWWNQPATNQQVQRATQDDPAVLNSGPQ